jgi:hypothetical protein
MENNITFLSKNASDEYINMLAKSFGVAPTHSDQFNFNETSGPIFLRGILKFKLMQQCWAEQRDFYYMDSGYIGNYKSPINPNGFKLFHRIVKNDLQHDVVEQRPSDRLEKLGIKIPTWKRDGKNILVVMPSEKPARFYNIDMVRWRRETVEIIQKHTDRPIVIREKAKRQERIEKTIYQELDNAFAVVTLQSIAATEAILYGIPAFTLAPNAAMELASDDLTQIEQPRYPDQDEVYEWACHLAYGQFHIDELKDGTAKRILGF